MKGLFKLSLIVFASAQLVSCSKEKITTPATAQSQDKALLADSFYIGKSYGGGVIFYLDATGQHGLIASQEDQADSIAWSNGTAVLTNATGIAIGTGFRDTKAIVNAQGKTGSYAALACTKYKKDGFKDWFLPSREELNTMVAQKAVINNFDNKFYWSSTEVNISWARYVYSGNTYQSNYPKTNMLHVRAIRRF